jgi:hypothetical protein
MVYCLDLHKYPFKTFGSACVTDELGLEVVVKILTQDQAGDVVFYTSKFGLVFLNPSEGDVWGQQCSIVVGAAGGVRYLFK